MNRVGSSTLASLAAHSKGQCQEVKKGREPYYIRIFSERSCYYLQTINQREKEKLWEPSRSKLHKRKNLNGGSNSNKNHNKERQELLLLLAFPTHNADRIAGVVVVVVVGCWPSCFPACGWLISWEILHSWCNQRQQGQKKKYKKVVEKKHRIRKIKRKFSPYLPLLLFRLLRFVFHLVYSFAGAHEN